MEDLLDQKASLERAVVPLLATYCTLTSRLSLSALQASGRLAGSLLLNSARGVPHGCPAGFALAGRPRSGTGLRE